MKAAKRSAPAPKAHGGGKQQTKCQAKATHRAAQAKYVAKAPKAQTARVAKSSQKQGTQRSQGQQWQSEQGCRNARQDEGPSS
jgi:hypothetical protein